MPNRNSFATGFRRRISPGSAGLFGLALAVVAGGLVGNSGRSIAAATTQSAGEPAQEIGLRHADLTRRITELSQKYPRRVTKGAIGKSSRGRDIPVIEIRGENADRDTPRGALLVVAGLSATRVAATDVAMALAERWADPTPTSMPATAPASQPASQPAHILDVCDVYIVPRLNVDGAERFLSQPRDANDLSDEPVDNDRDRVPDDDGPSDLNGDGFITQMRVRDPEATHKVDDKDARLIRPADRAAAEHPVYKIYTESLDADGDGEYGEDGPGGVDLDRNFPHGFKPHVDGTGRYPLSAPESRELTEYVIAHPEILAVVVLDRGDNLAGGTPGGPNGEVVPDDEGIWKHITERYKALVGLTDVTRGSTDGSFVAWIYRQRGLPAVESALWQLPKDEPTSQPTSAPATSQATTQTSSAPAEGAASSQPAASSDHVAPPNGPPAGPPGDRDEPRMGRRGRPGGGGGGGRGQGGGRFGRGGGRPGGPGGPGPGGPGRMGGDAGAAAPTPGGSGDIDKDRRWLQYFDKHPDIKGYVNWTPFRHPTLGDVEIGGFVAGVRENAPADKLPDIVNRELQFCSEFAAMLPRPHLAGVKVTEKATNVFEIELSLVNDAYLPTALAMSRTAGQAMPFVLRPQLTPEAILAGRPVEKIPFLDGAGGTAKIRWLIRGERGSTLTINLFNKQFKMNNITVELVPTPTTTQATP